jgi:hypothetical protein
MGCVMFFTKEMDIFGTTLDMYRPCFTKPQWNHFNTYLAGLLLGEKGEKNIQDIAGNLLDGGHQSSLNRFITRHHWDVRRFNALRLNECLRDRKGGVLSLDDTTMYEYLLKSKEVLTQTAAPCPKCGTKIKYENYPGNRVTMVCPTCGSTESVSLEKPSKQPRTRLFFSSPKEKQ